MVRGTGTSPALLKANGSSHSSGKFKVGGVRPQREGGLETSTEKGGVGTFAHTESPGPGSAAALPARTEPPHERACSASEGCPCQRDRQEPSPPPATPAWVSPESAAVEQGSRCLQSSPLGGCFCSTQQIATHPSHPSCIQPRHCCPPLWEYGEQKKWRPSSACLRGPSLPLAGKSPGLNPAGHQAQA